MKWGICTSETDCRSWGVPDQEWDIHNESQLAKVDPIEIQERHSGLDYRSQLCQNFNYWPNHRPGHTQQWTVQLPHEYPSRVSVTNALGCRSEVSRTTMIFLHVLQHFQDEVSPCLIFWHQTSIIVSTMFIAEWDWQLCCNKQDDMCPGLWGAPELWPYPSNWCGIATNEQAVTQILTQVHNIA
jgi:hypothetical protein